MKLMQAKSEDKLIAKVGLIVTVKVDCQDVSHEKAIQGFLAKVSKSGAGEVVVISKLGIIC